MKVRATVSFSGLISMGLGEVGEITDTAILSDLLRAGYVEEVEKAKAKEAEEPKKKAKSK